MSKQFSKKDIERAKQFNYNKSWLEIARRKNEGDTDYYDSKPELSLGARLERLSKKKIK